MASRSGVIVCRCLRRCRDRLNVQAHHIPCFHRSGDANLIRTCNRLGPGKEDKDDKGAGDKPKEDKSEGKGAEKKEDKQARRVKDAAQDMDTVVGHFVQMTACS